MMTLRKAQDRGHANHGWLVSWHSFSFADYYDPRHMGWGHLRVLNDDVIAPGTGFGMHGHRDMEIISYVLAGELTHQDSMGHVKTITAGEVQRMSAGRGVRHSEFNHHPEARTHLLQIWITPHTQGIEPGYEQKFFAPEHKRGRLCLIASGDPNDQRQGALTLHADARLYAGLLEGDECAQLLLDPARKTYVHLARGSLQVNGLRLQAGDAALLEAEKELTLLHGEGAEVLVFDLGLEP